MLTAADWRRGLTDPAYFAATILGVELHPGQKLWLEQSTARENLLVTGNRWGKSFVSAVKLLHSALYQIRPLRFDRSERYRAVVASITQDQANLVFRQLVRLVYQSDCLPDLVESHQQTPHPCLTFGNGASIEARTTQNRGEYLLGNDYDLVIFDEVAFETHLEYVVEEVIMMRLADREGRLDLVSTPNGKNWFYLRAREIIEGKRPGYLQRGDSRDNPYLSAEFLGERLQYFSEARQQQNIMGQFVDSGGEVLAGALVDAAMVRDYNRPKEATLEPRRFATGWDLARKRTATVGITVELVAGIAYVVALERFKEMDWNFVLQKIRQRQMEFPGELVIDATGLGDVVLAALDDYRPTGIIFTSAVKADLLTNVELMHARGEVAYGRWQCPDGPGRSWSLEDDLRRARWDDNNECDALMALALALRPMARAASSIIPPRVGRV